jgi:hypothetical protein
MRHAPVPGGAHKPVHVGRTRGNEQLVEVCFAVAHRHDLRVRAALRQPLELLQPLQPLCAFLLGERSCPPPIALAQLGRIARPAFQAHHAQGQPLGGKGELAVHEEAAQMRLAAMAQPGGGRKMRQIELGRVGRGQHHGQSAHARQRLPQMRAQHPIGVDMLVVEEAIGRLQLRGRQCLREGAMGALGQLPRQRHQAFGTPRIAQFGCAEFFDRPIVFCRLRQSAASPLRAAQRLTRVYNCLQDIYCSLIHDEGIVGKPQPFREG